MKKLLRFLIIFLLCIFGLGFYKHNFDLDAYISYLNSEGATNFVEQFSPSDPQTWLSFLYDTHDTTDSDMDELDAELAKLDELALNSGDIQYDSGSDMGPTDLLSGGSLSGQLLSGEVITSGAITSGDAFADFEDFFKQEDANLAPASNTGIIEPLPSISGTARIGPEITNITINSGTTKNTVTTGTNTTTKDILTKEIVQPITGTTIAVPKTGEKILTGGKEVPSITGEALSLTGATGTGKKDTSLSTPLLQKRLNQYKEFKKTLKK